MFCNIGTHTQSPNKSEFCFICTSICTVTTKSILSSICTVTRKSILSLLVSQQSVVNITISTTLWAVFTIHQNKMLYHSIKLILTIPNQLWNKQLIAHIVPKTTMYIQSWSNYSVDHKLHFCLQTLLTPVTSVCDKAENATLHLRNSSYTATRYFKINLLFAYKCDYCKSFK